MNLKQLSLHLNLSQTTVSRALNGYPEVSDATRKRVQEAAAAMNYSPNTRAKGLATGRSMAIGHVLPMATKHEIVNPVFGDFIAGASEAYVQAGYDMVLSVVADSDEERLYREMQSKRNVDGIIVHGPKMRDGRIALLNEIGLPYVVHGRASDVTAPYSWVDVNNRRAFEHATLHLLELGHRRIALVNGLEFMDFAHRRREGYLTALRQHHVAPDPALMRSDEMTETHGFDSARDMLALDNPPTAFLSSSMITAIGIRRAIAARGLTMGRDVSVITHDDALSYLPNGDEAPIFTSTRSSVREAGLQSAEMLLSMISTGDGTPRNLLKEAELILGASTAPMRAQPR